MRTCRELLVFLYAYMLPYVLICVLILIGLLINESCLAKMGSPGFWVKIIKIYLIAVGFYLELLFLFLLYMIYDDCKDELLVRNLEPANIQLL